MGILQKKVDECDGKENACLACHSLASLSLLLYQQRTFSRKFFPEKGLSTQTLAHKHFLEAAAAFPAVPVSDHDDPHVLLTFFDGFLFPCIHCQILTLSPCSRVFFVVVNRNVSHLLHLPVKERQVLCHWIDGPQHQVVAGAT